MVQLILFLLLFVVSYICPLVFCFWTEFFKVAFLYAHTYLILSHLISSCQALLYDCKGFFSWRRRISHWKLLLEFSHEVFFSLYSCIFTCKWVILLGHPRTAQKLKINSHCPRLSRVLRLNRTDFICLVFYFSLYFLIFCFLVSFLSALLFYFILEILSVRFFNQKKLFFQIFLEILTIFVDTSVPNQMWVTMACTYFSSSVSSFHDCYLWGKQFHQISYKKWPLRRKDKREKWSKLALILLHKGVVSVQHQTVHELPHWLQKSDSKPRSCWSNRWHHSLLSPKQKGRSGMNLGRDQRAEKKDLLCLRFTLYYQTGF